MRDHTRRAFFIGRWSPLHLGHDHIIRKALDAGKPVLIGIRDTPMSDSDPYTAYERIAMITAHYKDDDVKVIVMPDIESVNIGRKVGYEVNRYDVPEDIAGISATEIRQLMRAGHPGWQSRVPPAVANFLQVRAVKKTVETGGVIWLTGLPCSGKSTIAEALEPLFIVGPFFKILDGDELRTGLSSDLKFSKEDRDENIRRVAHVATMLADEGFLVVTAFISPYRATRAKAREIIGANRFFEVHVKCSVDVCKERDVKGMYAMAAAGEIKGFTGVDDPYEEPEDPMCVLDTDKMSVKDCVSILLDKLGYWE